MDLKQTPGHGRAAVARHGRGIWSPPWLQNRSKPVRIAVRTAALILLALLLVWLILFITKGRFLKGPFEDIASANSGRAIEVGGDFQLYFAPLDVKFLAEDIRVANPGWAAKEAPDFFAARRIDTRISTWALIWGDTRFKMLNMDHGRVDLRWDAKRERNSWTFDTEQPAKSLEIPEIERAQITGTNIAYRDPLFMLVASIQVDTVKARDTAFEQSIRFRGDGTLRDKPFGLLGSLLSPNETVRGGRNRLTLRARSGQTRVSVVGTMPGTTDIEGGAFKTSATGPNLARLFDFIGVAVPETRTYNLKSDLAYRDGVWRFTGMDGMIGETDIAGTMLVSMPNQRLYIDADLATKRADIVDIGPVFGFDPRSLEAGTITHPAANGSPRLIPDAPLRMDAVQRFDADVDYTIGAIRNDYAPVSDIAVALKLKDAVITIDPVTMNLAGGELAANATIDASKLPVRSEFDLRLAPTGMGTLLARFGVQESGTTGTVGGRVQLRGIGDSLHQMLATSQGRIAFVMPKGTMWARNVQLSELDIGVFVQKMFEDELEDPVQINCGLVAFTVRDGIGAADPILIDTSKNVILGRGGFSFKTERIDMAMRADGKKFSLFSGQSPVGLEGYFAEPAVDPISGELLGRAGAAIGLGAVVSPFAAVISFIDIGDAKAADCGPVLRGAGAKTQRTAKGGPRDDVGRGTTAKSEDGSISDEEAKAQRDKLLRDRG